MSKLPTAEQIQHDWDTNPRWEGIQRNYSAADVVRLRGTVHIEHSLARLGAEKLWASLHEREFVNALGALTGNQAMQQGVVDALDHRRHRIGQQHPAARRPAAPR
jgi:isocitrate lyase